MTIVHRAFLVAALAAAVALPSRADDGQAPAQQAPSADAAALLQQMQELYPRAMQRPAGPDLSASDLVKARAESAKAEKEWDAAVKALAKAGDDYIAALGGSAPDARGLYLRGVGKLLAAERVESKQAPGYYDAAAESLQRYLDATDEKAAFRADAEMHLGRALLFTRRLDEAVAHMTRAVDLLQKDSRHDDAGECASLAMRQLKSMHRDAELRAFSAAIHAGEADFGRSTPVVRTLWAAARLSVGAKLPEMPKAKDADGNDISWAPGKPMLMHFFLTGFLGGRPTTFREIETDIRPLWQKHGEKVRFLGVSMDYEMPKEQAEEMRKKWEEWGRKMDLRDGSIESVRDWTVKKGVEWPWYWDGKATNNPLSLTLGGVGVTSPFVVLVDKDGVVRWLGEAPFEGLADEVAKLVQ
jgi:tetratricopeptide (TPR) repeat protein